MAVLGGTGGLSYWATRGGPAKKDDSPPINATSKDEENFIQYVLPRPDSPPQLRLFEIRMLVGALGPLVRQESKG